MMAYEYTQEELEVVRKAISRGLSVRNIKAEKVEVMESCRFNLKAEILIRGSTEFSMDDLSYITRKVPRRVSEL
ncbi:MAG TPA: hypothetical protein ENF57_01015 [Candidatus Korarchaeota archaeon]|nr:hypothetical protein [Candidatus Korarchaeota archaeon]